MVYATVAEAQSCVGPCGTLTAVGGVAPGLLEVDGVSSPSGYATYGGRLALTDRTPSIVTWATEATASACTRASARAAAIALRSAARGWTHRARRPRIRRPSPRWCDRGQCRRNRHTGTRSTHRPPRPWMIRWLQTGVHRRRRPTRMLRCHQPELQLIPLRETPSHRTGELDPAEAHALNGLPLPPAVR